jgi:hypothetical protein
MSTFGMLANRVLDATLRGGNLAGGNRDQVKEDINEAIKQVDAVLRPNRTISIEVLVAGQKDYSMAALGLTAATSIRSITYTSVTSGQQGEPLQETTPERVRELRIRNQNASWINMYALDGLDTLMVNPAMNAVGDTIAITYVPRSTALVNETDIPSGLPEEWHDIYELAAIQRSMRQSSPEYAAHYLQMYEHKLDEYRKWRNRRSGALGMTATVGRYGRRPAWHDNSADWR